MMFLASSIFAQADKAEEAQGKRHEHAEKHKEALKAKKIGYLTNELDLSSEEAQRFWPVYNDYEKKVHALRKESKDQMRNIDQASDANSYDLLMEDLDRSQKILDMKKNFFENLGSVIPKEKVTKLYVAELKFKKEVLDNVKRKMHRNKRK